MLTDLNGSYRAFQAFLLGGSIVIQFPDLPYMALQVVDFEYNPRTSITLKSADFQFVSAMEFKNFVEQFAIRTNREVQKLIQKSQSSDEIITKHDSQELKDRIHFNCKSEGKQLNQKATNRRKL